MSLKIDRVQLEIIVQQDSARQQMVELEKQMRNASRELSKLEKQFGENSEQYKAQAAVVRNLKQQYDDLFNEIGIGHLSLKELANRQRELNAILRNIDPSLPEWKQYNQQLKEVNARIKELKGTATETGLSLGKLADGFNRYAAIGASALATLTGMTLTMRKCVDEYAQMEEAESQVIKYTGMTAEEVKQLNEEFKAMDTRTPREELNRLAGEAGKLGITGVQEVREFVEAANQINVALGEDLGEEAVNQIGKLSQMFGDESRSLKDNMLAIGSAVNQVAQSTSASEPYLVQFTARMGGVGKQAKMSVTDIMGFASALDQNMLRSEMASTALSGLIMRIYQEPAKYAKLAGMDVEQFTQLVETDVNEAVMSFLSALNKMGGMAQIAPVLKEMQLSGAEAASVISTLAGNVDLVRKEQENANKAFTEGTSITNEYAVQNNTVQARLEKLQNDFKNVRVELGERLLPVMRYMISTGSLTVKGLMSLTNVLSEYKGEIAGMVVALGTVYTAQKTYVYWTKLSDLWTTKFDGSFKKLSKTLIRSGWGLVVAGAGTLVGHLMEAKLKADDLKESLSGMDKVTRETGEAFAQQDGKIRALTSVINDSGVALDERRKSLEKLKEIVPEYNAMLTDEGTLTNNNTEAIKKYLVQLEKQVKMKAALEELENLYKRQRKLSSQESEQSSAYWNIRQQNTLQGYDRNSLTAKASRLFGMSEEDNALKKLESTRKELSSIKGQIAEINEEIATTSVELEKTAGKISKDNNDGEQGTTTGTTVLSGGTDDTIKALEDRFKLELQAQQNAAKEKKLQQIQEGEDSAEIEGAYNDALFKAEMEFLQKKKAALQAYGQDTTEIQGQIYDKMIDEANRLYEAEQAQDAANRQAAFDAVDADADAQRRAAKQAFINGELQDEQAYRDRLLEIERDYLQARKALLASFGEDTSEVDDQLLNLDVSQKQGSDRQAARGKRTQREEGLSQIRKSTDADEQNAIAQRLYEEDLINFEEYQELKTKIAEEQEQRRQEIAQAAMNTIGQAAGAASQLIGALQDAELSRVQRKYDKEIAAARKAGKDTTKLEEEKEAAMNAVKKKYADKQFAANVLQVTASTAVAAMNAYSAMASIPIVGPALGAIAAAAAIAAGAAQIAVAKQQRDEAKGLKSGGYSADYVEGYTPRGNPDDTAGVIPVHKNEFVANHEAVANPDVKQFLDVFDVAQKRGTIRMLNTTQILEQIRTRGGRYSGGYTAENAGASRSSASPLPGFTAEQRSQVVLLLEENNRLLTVLTQKELVVDPRKVRDSINHINQLEKNVSR